MFCEIFTKKFAKFLLILYLSLLQLGKQINANRVVCEMGEIIIFEMLEVER